MNILASKDPPLQVKAATVIANSGLEDLKTVAGMFMTPPPHSEVAFFSVAVCDLCYRAANANCISTRYKQY